MQKKRYEIEAATLADLNRIVEIDQVSFSQPWAPRTFQDVLDDDKSIVLVARFQDDVSYQDDVARDEDDSPIDEIQADAEANVWAFGVATIVGDEAEIATLAVALEARGQGLGERLLREVMRLSANRGARRLFLEVRPSNASAQRLYERLGFYECGRRPNYYADGEDALIMRADCDEKLRDENIGDENDGRDAQQAR